MPVQECVDTHSGFPKHSTPCMSFHTWLCSLGQVAHASATWALKIPDPNSFLCFLLWLAPAHPVRVNLCLSQEAVSEMEFNMMDVQYG